MEVHDSLILATIVLLLYSSTVGSDRLCTTDKLERIDCYPEGNATEALCSGRGCCWDGTVTVDEGPWNCFFPVVYGYAAVHEPRRVGNTWRVQLQRIDAPSLYGCDVTEVAVLVEEQSNNRVRIKIYDPINNRFEVPYIKINSSPFGTPASRNYEIDFVESPFGVKVTRKTTGKTIFDSSMSGMVFADQFLQMTTRLGSTDVYGLGEHLHTSFKRDLNWRTWPIHAAGKHPTGPEAKNMYGVHPMYLNIEDGGNANIVLLLNQHAMDVVLQPTPAVTFRTIGGVLDFYVFLSEDDETEETCPRDGCESFSDTSFMRSRTISVIESYQQAIGLPAMPPYWALGFQLCRWEYEGSDHLKAVIRRTREAGIPYDVQWGDVDYMVSAQSFTIDANRYPDLPDIIEDLHQHGQKYVAIHDPGIKVTPDGEYDPYDDGCRKDLWVKHNSGEVLHGQVWPGICVFADYTKDDTVEWWIEHAVKFHAELPFDGFWIDMNEPSNFIYGSTKGCENNTWNFPPYVPKITGGLLWDRTLCMDARQHLGRHYDLHSLYGHTMINATWQAAREIYGQKRSLIVSRSSFVGSGQFAGKWLGDNKSSFDDMRWSVTGMIEMNMFGLPYVGADICGFFNHTTEHLCQRWMQLGAFYPMSRNHNHKMMKDQDPAAFSPEMVASSRDVLLTRYSLLPYLYTLFHLAHTRGSPVIRPLVFEFPLDQATQSTDEQFLWGPALLISPVFKEDTYSVNAYFPKTRWYDFYTGGEMQETGSYITLNAPIHMINLHLRGGYIIPTQQPDVTTQLSRRNPMGLIISIGEHSTSEGLLFLDDGYTMNSHLTPDKHRLLSFKYSKNEITIISTKGSFDVGVPLSIINVYGLLVQPNTSSFFLHSTSTTEIPQDRITWSAGNQVLCITDLDIDMNVNTKIVWQN